MNAILYQKIKLILKKTDYNPPFLLKIIIDKTLLDDVNTNCGGYIP